MLTGGSSGGYGAAAPRILIVDDDPDLLVLLADQLRADGYEITTARDGVEASRRLETAWPDLLIIDMMMPRRDGLSLAREIKAIADLPIIVLSAIDAADSKADLLDEVAEDYVTKPYHYPELRARINRVLRRLGDKVPRRSLIMGPGLTLDLHRREATVAGHGGQADADRVAAPVRPRGEPRQDRLHRHAPGPRLGRDRGRRPLVRVGDDAAPPSEARGRPQPADPPDHGPRRRLPARGGDVHEDRALARQRRWLTTVLDDAADETRGSPSGSSAADRAEGSRFGFRSRLTIALIASAILPLAGFGILLLLIGNGGRPTDPNVGRLLLFSLAIVVTLAIITSYLLVADLTAPLRSIAAAVDRVSAGDLSTPIRVAGDDELAQLAESHNRLASDLERRNQELGRILAAIEAVSPRDGVDFLATRAADDARVAFGMIDAAIYIGDPSAIPIQDRVPGESRPLRAILRAGSDVLGVLFGRLPATRRWERADQDLLDLFAHHVAVAVRNAQLFAQVEAQNAQLIELDATKDEFLRGISHNLQTPLTSIRAHADQLGNDRPDRRLGIITEQSERLSRMVRQLLTVTRLEAGTFHPRTEVVALGSRIRKAWEALGVDDVEFAIDDQTEGWLAIADADQLDQVLWALLDNALKYGERQPVEVVVTVEAEADRLRATITDGGPGVLDEDRDRLFGRFERGSQSSEQGSGLGLYVSRELCRAMDGDLVLEPQAAGRGAAFSIYLPGEPATEG